MSRRPSQFQRRGALMAGVALGVAALWMLRGELSGATSQQLTSAVASLSANSLALAALLTIASYAVLTEYEQLACACAGVSLSRWRIALAAFVGSAVAHNVGFSLLSGTAVRYRFYARWKLTPRQIASIVAFQSGTFWLGLCAIGGWSLLAADVEALNGLPGAHWARPAGAVLLAMSCLYLLVSVCGRRVRIGSRRFDLPPWRTAVAQYLLSMLDWTLSAAVLWALLPDPRPAFVPLILAFVIAQLIGLASHVPGGLGAFEAVMIVQLRGMVPVEALLPALVAFRGVYYLGPFAVAIAILTADQCRQRWRRPAIDPLAC